jgi:transposase
MSRLLHGNSLIPPGLKVEEVSVGTGVLLVSARLLAISAPCPSCGNPSARLHSRYQRKIADLPTAGRRVSICLTVRRFRCVAPACRTRIFAERLDQSTARRYGRRTNRLDCIVHQLGLALGGRPGQGFARRLMVPVSNDTLLRVVRRRTRLATDPLTVIGIDDWAFRRNHSYGSIVCDLERRRIVALLPDREVATIERWLAVRPEIRIIARDRGGGYGEAAAKALPAAVQVADRWHLMENASAAFFDAVHRSMGSIRTALGAATITPELLTYVEKLQYEGYLRRQENDASIMKLSAAGVPIKEIVRRTGHSRKLVRQVIRGQRGDVFRVRQSSLDIWLPFLDEQWIAGCRNGAGLWRRLKARGFRGCLGVVSEWARRRRNAERVSDRQLHKVPSARTVARLMTVARDQLSKADMMMIATIEKGVPMLTEARDLIDSFQAMLRKKATDDLEPWIAQAAKSVFCQRHRPRLCSRPGCHRRTMIKRANRRPNYETQTD